MDDANVTARWQDTPLPNASSIQASDPAPKTLAVELKRDFLANDAFRPADEVLKFNIPLASALQAPSLPTRSWNPY